MRRSVVSTAVLFGLTVLLAGEAAVAQVLYLPTERQTTGRRVRSAFRETASQAGAWTVEVRRGGTQVALGLVVSNNGQILTKLSQIEALPGGWTQFASTTGGGDSGASKLTCLVPGGKLLEATIVATDSETDLTLLKVEAEGLKPASWAKEFEPRLGRWVVTPAMGGSVSTIGIVSAQPRAIPAEKVFGVLGIQLDRVGGTARVMEVFDDSGAKAAGLKPGDVITRCDDKEIPDGATLVTRLRQMKPGEQVTLKVRREEKVETIKVTLTHPFGIFLSQFAQQNRMGTELSQRTDGYEEVFSHDGHVDPNECGGPLLDLDGRVVGINIARAGRTETLALPVSVIEKSLERLQGEVKLPESSRVSAEAGP